MLAAAQEAQRRCTADELLEQRLLAAEGDAPKRPESPCSRPSTAGGFGMARPLSAGVGAKPRPK
jgi:hypothetical protein